MIPSPMYSMLNSPPSGQYPTQGHMMLVPQHMYQQQGVHNMMVPGGNMYQNGNGSNAPVS